MNNTITSTVWWKAAVIRGLRTALVIAAPYVGGASLTGIPWAAAASAAGLGFILSLATSLLGLPETTGTAVPIWLAWTTRVVKTIAQSLVAGIGQNLLFQEVHWVTILQASLIAGFGSLVLAVITKLPETTTPASPAPATVSIAPAIPPRAPITPPVPTVVPPVAPPTT